MESSQPAHPFSGPPGLERLPSPQYQSQATSGEPICRTSGDKANFEIQINLVRAWCAMCEISVLSISPVSLQLSSGKTNTSRWPDLIVPSLDKVQLPVIGEVNGALFSFCYLHPHLWEPSHLPSILPTHILLLPIPSPSWHFLFSCPGLVKAEPASGVQ